jgi:hypothetical protein
LAENSDGGGAATDDVLDGNADDFDFGSDGDWAERARYFAYQVQKGNESHVCVFPEEDYAGMPLLIHLGEVLTTAAPFGESIAWPGDHGCPP